MLMETTQAFVWF